jgi:hypothetical protein
MDGWRRRSTHPETIQVPKMDLGGKSVVRGAIGYDVEDRRIPSPPRLELILQAEYLGLKTFELHVALRFPAR